MIKIQCCLTLILYLFAAFSAKAQCTIELPYSNLEVQYDNLTPLFKVRVCSSENVYIEDTLVEIENLGDSLFVHKDEISAELMLRLQIHLLADKNVKYSLIDKIKSQITSAHIYTLIYKTNNIEDVTKGIFFRNLSQSFGALSYKEKEIEENNSVNNNIDFPEIITISQPKEVVFKNELYSLNTDNAKELLNDLNYINIKLIGNKRILIDGKRYKLKNQVKIWDIIKNQNLLLLSYSDKLTYEDYIKNIIEFKKLYKQNHSASIPFIIEISGELQNTLNKEGISF